ADALILAKDRIQELFQNAIRALNEAMDELRRKGEDRYGASFKKVLDGRRRLAEGKIPRSENFSPEIQQILNEITEAMQQCERLNAEWMMSFNDSINGQAEILQAFARDPMFQEAVIWQNRQAFETAMQSVAREHRDSPRNQRQRNHRELTPNYLNAFS